MAATCGVCQSSTSPPHERGDGKESYLYDGHGRRARPLNLQTGTIEYYGYGKDGRLLQDWSNRRQVRNGYVYLGNTVVGLYEVNLTNGTMTPKYQHTDALGSPVVTTNAGKTVLSRMSYTPYGLPTLPMDGVGYTGHFMDVGTQLTYMQQRYYDPQIGRFLSTDPANAGFNRYPYAANNPLRFVDPDGRVQMEPNGSLRMTHTRPTTDSFSVVESNSVTTTVLHGTAGTAYANDGSTFDAAVYTSGETTTSTFDANGALLSSSTVPVTTDNGVISNCHGTTFASGQAWINDSQVQAVAEGDGYQPVATPGLGAIGIFSENGTLGTALHSVTVVGVSETGVTAVGGRDNVGPYTVSTPQEAWNGAEAQLNYYARP